MSQHPAMRVIIGAPVTESDFYPRDHIVNKLTRVLEIEHVLFLAPRRTGKTSVLLNLKNITSAQAVFIDLEGFDHPALWIKAMIRELSKIQDNVLMQKIKRSKPFLHRVKSRHFEFLEASWEEQADSLLKDLNELNKPLGFLFDEFPVMIDKIAQKHDKALASAALHWFRRLRQQNIKSSVRFLLTGSIGLDNVLRRHGLRGPANDLRREVLPPLGADEALQFALKLAHDNEIPLSEDLALEYIQRLGPAIWPYFIQLFIAELQDQSLGQEQPLNLEKIYRSVAHGKRNQYADNMWQRLSEIFNEAEVTTARELLKKIAAVEAGTDLTSLRAQLPQLTDNDFSYVLDVLQHDGYLIEDDMGRMHFFSHLLRDYWRYKNHV